MSDADTPQPQQEPTGGTPEKPETPETPGDPTPEQPVGTTPPAPQPDVAPAAPAPETPAAAPQESAPEPVAPAPSPPVMQPAERSRPQTPGTQTYLGTGRRKSSVARVRVTLGKGEVKINHREIEKYFTEIGDQQNVTAPLRVTGCLGQYDVRIRVNGGGRTGQSGAILLGVARALVEANRDFEPTLREAGYLTRDARRVERKKYGRRKARRRFQFSKR